MQTWCRATWIGECAIIHLQYRASVAPDAHKRPGWRESELDRGCGKRVVGLGFWVLLYKCRQVSTVIHKLEISMRAEVKGTTGWTYLLGLVMNYIGRYGIEESTPKSVGAPFG